VRCLGDSVGVVVTRLINWVIEEYLDSRHKQEVFLFSKMFGMILDPKQPSIQYVPWTLTPLVSVRIVKVATHLHLVLTSISGAVFPIPAYDLFASTGTTLPLTLQSCVALRRGYFLRNASLGDFVVVRMSYSVLTQTQIV